MWRGWLLVAWFWGAFAAAAEAQGAALNPPWLTGQSRPEDLTVALVHVGPGDAIYELFGHVALEVRDRRLRMAALYNFGTFSFDSAFLLRVLGGRLHFRLGVEPARPSYRAYAAQDRDVRVTELDLTPEQADRLARALALNALPERRDYLYHHLLDNCATRIVEVFAGLTDGAFKKAYAGPGRLTFREHIRRYTARAPLFDFLIALVNDSATDRPITRLHELFLPAELAHAVQAFRYRVGAEERSLVRRQWIEHEAHIERQVFANPPERWPHALALGLGCGALLLGVGRLYAWRPSRRWRVLYGALTACFGLLLGLLGVGLLSFSLFAAGGGASLNQNLFFVHPLPLLLGVSGLALTLGAAWARRACAILWSALAGLATLGLFFKLFSGVQQDNSLVWMLLWPIFLGGALGALRARGHSDPSVAGAAASAGDLRRASASLSAAAVSSQTKPSIKSR